MNDEVRKIYQPSAQAVISSDFFSTYSIADKYILLQRKTGLDFSASISILQKLPTFLDGDAHRCIRKQMAVLLASTKKKQEAEVERTLRILIDEKFKKPGVVELVSEFATPLWRSISRQIVGESPGFLALADAIPQLFIPALSIRKRLEINSMIESEVAKRNLGEADLIMLGSAVLGARPFTGTMALSVYNAVANNAGERSRDMQWPPEFDLSSLRYVDRVCNTPTTVGEHAVGDGERLRCVTQHPDYTSEQNAESLFGFGMHLCLGKPIAQSSWRAVTGAMRGLDCRLTPAGIEMDRYSDPFFMPIFAKIQVETETDAL
jgi:hypothetical protein